MLTTKKPHIKEVLHELITVSLTPEEAARLAGQLDVLLIELSKSLLPAPPNSSVRAFTRALFEAVSDKHINPFVKETVI